MSWFALFVGFTCENWIWSLLSWFFLLQVHLLYKFLISEVNYKILFLFQGPSKNSSKKFSGLWSFEDAICIGYALQFKVIFFQRPSYIFCWLYDTVFEYAIGRFLKMKFSNTSLLLLALNSPSMITKIFIPICSSCPLSIIYITKPVLHWRGWFTRLEWVVTGVDTFSCNSCMHVLNCNHIAVEAWSG